MATPLGKGSLFSQFISTLQTENIDFVMKKKIPNVSRVFENAGKIKFVRDQGFIFQQHYPHVFTFISTKEKYCTLEHSDEVYNLPHFDDISKLVDGILSADEEALSAVFEMQYEENQDTWKLSLTPKISELSSLFNLFTIEGNVRQINRILIEYKDKTVITFTFFKTEDVIKDEIRC